MDTDSKHHLFSVGRFGVSRYLREAGISPLDVFPHPLSKRIVIVSTAIIDLVHKDPFADN